MVFADKDAEGVHFLALEERDLQSRMGVGGGRWMLGADRE